jgi:glycosyltransferase involved in cell wall biosynthesis
MITFGIPSFNRARYLAPLVESIYASNLAEFEILIVEDDSPERAKIREVALSLKEKLDDGLHSIRYIENSNNKGYDKNLKEILRHAKGEVVVFVGNDDLANTQELATYVAEIEKNSDADVFLRGYSTFDDLNGTISKTQIIQNSRLADRRDDLPTVYRFSAIISGFGVRKNFAQRIETDKFDGGLFYQIYLSLAALTFSKVFISASLPVRCRRDIPPEFGSSSNEPGFVAGSYQVEARIRMVESQLAIAEYFAPHHGADFMRRYRQAMSQNIAPHLGELQRNKWRDMPRLYLYLIRNGIGCNLRSFVIFAVLLLFSKTQAARIFNRISNAFRLSTVN